MKWKYFLAAAVSVSLLLMVNGVPLLPILLGCGAVAVWNFRSARHE
jgi:hypothetical protein